MLAKFDESTRSDERRRQGERRRIPRSAASAGVSVRSMQGESARAVVRDVSTFGCSLVFADPWRRVGMILQVTGPQGDRIDAVVRWFDEEACGVEFMRPVPAAETVLGSSD